jgi:hypothetical protein
LHRLGQAPGPVVQKSIAQQGLNKRQGWLTRPHGSILLRGEGY